MDPRRFIAAAALRCLNANASYASAQLSLINDYRISYIARPDHMVDTV